MPSDQKPATYDANVKLCRAVEEYPCIYDRESPNYVKKEEYDLAWEAIANVCGESVASCKVRWRNIRTAFIRSVQGTSKMRLPNRTREYYLHDVLQFFLPHLASAETEKSREMSEEFNTDKEKTVKDSESDSSKEIVDNNVKDEQKEQKISGTEPVEEHGNKKTQKLPFESKVKTFFIKEKRTKVQSPLLGKTDVNRKLDSSLPEETSQTHPNNSLELLNDEMHSPSEETESSFTETEKSIDDEGRFRFRRACKRGLDKTVVRELRVRKTDVEVKRLRRTIDNSKSVIKETTNKKALDGKKNLDKVEKQNRRKGVAEKVKEPLLPTDAIETQIKTVPAIENSCENNLPNTFKDAIVIKSSTKPNELPISNIILNKPISVVNQSVQCELLAATALDDDFLISLKPHMAEMNSRQKLHFKKKVYESMMDVFDNSANFPQKGEEIALIPDPTPIRISTPSEELRLTRELVALVQAAKHTPEVLKPISDAAAESSTNGTKDIPNQIALSDSSKKKDTSSNLSHQGSADFPTQNVIERDQNLLRKFAILDAKGERRRIYRIYPKGSLEGVSSGMQKITSSGDGTYIIPQTSAPSITSYVNSINPQIYKYCSHSTAAAPNSSSSPTNNSHESTSAVSHSSSSAEATKQRTMTIRSRIRTTPNGTPRQIVRRYSICGPPTTAGGHNTNTKALVPTNIATNAVNAFPATLNALIGPTERTFLVPPSRRKEISNVFKMPKVTSTVTTSTKTTPTISISTTTKTTPTISVGTTIIPISGYNQFITPSIPVTGSLASIKKSMQVPSTASASTSSEKSTDKRLSKQRKPDTVEKNSKKAETIQETAGIIASDNFATMNIKNEPIDETFL